MFLNLGSVVQRYVILIVTALFLAVPVIRANADEMASLKSVTFEAAILADHVRPHVEVLAGEELRGRAGRHKDKTRNYIIEQFSRTQLKPLFRRAPTTDDGSLPEASFLQEIPGAINSDDQVGIQGYNVGAWVQGTDPKLSNEFIIVSAHYDHLGMHDGQLYAGADDNATGVSMMLEVARQLSTGEYRPRRSVAFVAFDLEERLLWGSRWFAAHPPWPIERLKLFITADMIGRSLGDLPLATVFSLGSEHSIELKQALDSVGVPSGLSVCRLGTDLIGTRSDYGPFRDRSIPYLFFSTGEHPDYHTPRDTPDKIDYEKVARISSLILKLTEHVSNQESCPVWTEAIHGDLDEPRALHHITTMLLDVEKQRPLSSTQRFVVTNVRNRTRRILSAQSMSSDDRTWLIRMSQLLLVSVF